MIDWTWLTMMITEEGAQAAITRHEWNTRIADGHNWPNGKFGWEVYCCNEIPLASR